MGGCNQRLTGGSREAGPCHSARCRRRSGPPLGNHHISPLGALCVRNGIEVTSLHMMAASVSRSGWAAGARPSAAQAVPRGGYPVAYPHAPLRRQQLGRPWTRRRWAVVGAAGGASPPPPPVQDAVGAAATLPHSLFNSSSAPIWAEGEAVEVDVTGTARHVGALVHGAMHSAAANQSVFFRLLLFAPIWSVFACSAAAAESLPLPMPLPGCTAAPCAMHRPRDGVASELQLRRVFPGRAHLPTDVVQLRLCSTHRRLGPSWQQQQQQRWPQRRK